MALEPSHVSPVRARIDKVSTIYKLKVAARMFTVVSNFIGTFKTGDNINYNLAWLRLQYARYAVADDAERTLMRKPMIVALISITEAILYDFHRRAKDFRREGIATLAEEALHYIRGKTLEEFEKCIMSARRHDLFETHSDAFYDQLDELRKLRNRVHIQNSKRDFEPDEAVAFSADRMALAEIALERVTKFLSARHPRPGHTHHVQSFVFPWNEHFPLH